MINNHKYEIIIYWSEEDVEFTSNADAESDLRKLLRRP